VTLYGRIGVTPEDGMRQVFSIQYLRALAAMSVSAGGVLVIPLNDKGMQI